MLVDRNDIVSPGQHIGSLEEAAPGNGTYEKDNEVYSALYGRMVREHGVVSVLPKKTVVSLKPGQIIYGMVVDVLDTLALIEIEPLAKGRERFVPTQDYGVLRVMNIRRGFVPSVKQELKRGDIVRARVEEISQGIMLSIKEFDLGVVLAYCSVCRHTMNIFRNAVKCTYCGNIEKRKLSRLYGQNVILNEIKM